MHVYYITSSSVRLPVCSLKHSRYRNWLTVYTSNREKNYFKNCSLAWNIGTSLCHKTCTVYFSKTTLRFLPNLTGNTRSSDHLSYTNNAIRIKRYSIKALIGTSRTCAYLSIFVEWCLLCLFNKNGVFVVFVRNITDAISSKLNRNDE